MDCVIHGVAKSQTRLRDFHSYSHATQVPIFSRCLTYGKVESSLPAKDLELETIPLHFNFPLSIAESRYFCIDFQKQTWILRNILALLQIIDPFGHILKKPEWKDSIFVFVFAHLHGSIKNFTSICNSDHSSFSIHNVVFSWGL